MVNGQPGKDNIGKDSLQDMAVPGMPGSTYFVIQNQGRDRVFSLGNLRVHNVHVQNGERTNLNCGFCQTGVGAILATLDPETPPGTPEVVEGGGTNEAEPTPPPRGDGTGYEQREMLWS